MTTRTHGPTWQQCLACGDVLTRADPHTRCDCGGLLDIHHEPPPARGQALRDMLDRRRADPGSWPSGVWRYAELVLPGAPEVITHPEGNTPLLTRARIAAWAGVSHLELKHEGHNPTGSFKDRGMTVGVTQAGWLRAPAVGCASTGNTSASLAAYAAQAGIPAIVLVPAGKVALGKLAQALACGARTLLVRADFDRCLSLIQEAEHELGLYLLNSVNPFRVEGQKTIVFELLQQRGWRVPDWIVLPGGNLGNTAAFGKALIEARELGLIDRLPRLGVVQASGAAPFAAAFAEGFVRRREVKAETVATAIRIGNPASWDRAVRAVRETNGVVTSVSDDEILEAKLAIDAAGVGCEPASAASVAGLRKLAGQAVIERDEEVVAVLTGHLLKDPEILIRMHQTTDRGANAPVEIEPSLREVERALRGEG